MELVEGRDYYVEGENKVLTAYALLRRGFCCQSGCRHCPYDETGRPRPEYLAQYPELLANAPAFRPSPGPTETVDPEGQSEAIAPGSPTDATDAARLARQSDSVDRDRPPAQP